MDDKSYHLCLFYAKNVHPRIIEKDFKSIYEIDIITRKYNDEKDFRNKRSNDIARCQYALFNYIEGMRKKGVKNERLNGEVYIMKNEQYIRPDYKTTAKTPLQLINSITDKLKEEQDNRLMIKYINRFKDFLYTDFTRVRGFQQYNSNIRKYKDIKVKSPYNKEDYNNLLDVINQALLVHYKRSTRSLDERHLFLYREMSDYLDNQIKSMRKEEEKKKELKIEEPQKEYDALESFYSQDELLPIKDQHYMDGEETYNPSLISFDDLPKIMEKFEKEEKERVRNDPNHVNAKDIPRLLQEYKNEREKIEQLIEEQRLKEDKEKVLEQSNGNFYIDENEQVAFTRTASTRDREELPDEDEYDNEGYRYR